MTVVSSVAATLYVFTGPGVYTFTFPVLEPSHIKCTLMKTGEEPIFLAYQTEYTVTLAPTGTGGSVTIPDPGYYIDWTDWSLEVRRVMPLTQEIDWVNNGPFSLPLIEYSIDKLTLMIQQIQAQMESGWIYPLPTAASLQQLLTDIKQIDGHNSGIDADTIDGLHSSQLVTLDGVAAAGLVTDTYLQAQNYVTLPVVQDEVTAATTPTVVLERLNSAFTLGNLILNSNGWIQAFAGPSGQQPRDYVLMDSGNLVFMRWLADESRYADHKSIKRIEYGSAPSGQRVFLTGIWDSPPKVIVSPNFIESYNAANKDQSQSWQVRADNIEETVTGSKKYQFDAVAELTLSSSNGTTSVNETFSAAANTQYSSEVSISNTLASLKVKVSSSSYQGTGVTTNQYNRRQVIATVQLWDGSTWIDSGSVTMNIGDSLTAFTTMDIPCVGVTGKTKFRVKYVASNRGGTFTSGAITYHQTGPHYSASGPSTTITTLGYSTDTLVTGTCNVPPIAMPADSYVSSYSVTYSASCDANWGGWAQFPDGTKSYSASSQSNHIYNGGSAVPLVVYGRQGYLGGQFVASVSLTISSAVATVYLMVMDKNTTAEWNSHKLVSYEWDLQGLTALALGSLNYMAVGD